MLVVLVVVVVVVVVMMMVHCGITTATTKTAVRVRATEPYDFQSHMLEVVCCNYTGRKITLS